MFCAGRKLWWKRLMLWRSMSHNMMSSRSKRSGQTSVKIQILCNTSPTSIQQVEDRLENTSLTFSTRSSQNTCKKLWLTLPHIGWLLTVRCKKRKPSPSPNSGRKSWNQCHTCLKRVVRPCTFLSKALRRSQLVRKERKLLSLAHFKIGRIPSQDSNLILSLTHKSTSSHKFSLQCLESRHSSLFSLRSLAISRKVRVKRAARSFRRPVRTIRPTWL